MNQRWSISQSTKHFNSEYVSYLYLAWQTNSTSTDGLNAHSWTSELDGVVHHIAHQERPSLLTPYSSTSFVTSPIRSTNALNDARRNRASTASKCLDSQIRGFQSYTSWSNAKAILINVSVDLLTRQACHRKQSSPSWPYRAAAAIQRHQTEFTTNMPWTKRKHEEFMKAGSILKGRI